MGFCQYLKILNIFFQKCIFNKHILSTFPNYSHLQSICVSYPKVFAFSVTLLSSCLSLCVSHSLVFLDYWPNEFLMDLVGRVQTLWDSGV